MFSGALALVAIFVALGWLILELDVKRPVSNHYREVRDEDGE